MKTKKCNKCLKIKLVTEMKGGFAQCKPCYNEYRKGLRAFYKKNDLGAYKKAREKERGPRYRREYWPDLTSREALNEYNRILSSQNNVCFICEKASGSRHLDVDHCHLTGRIRGLLCNSCNKAIGLLSDDPSLFKKISNYLLEQA